MNRTREHVRPLQVTIGDESQGTYATIPEGINATLELMLNLRGVADVRFGLGWGRVDVEREGDSQLGQDGPAWWSAREALDVLRTTSHKKQWPDDWRTRFQSDGGTLDRMVNAYLLYRDDILRSMDEKDARIVLSLMNRKSQDLIGREIGISQPAVSMRLKRKGLYALYRSFLEIREDEAWEH